MRHTSVDTSQVAALVLKTHIYTAIAVKAQSCWPERRVRAFFILVMMLYTALKTMIEQKRRRDTSRDVRMHKAGSAGGRWKRMYT